MTRNRKRHSYVVCIENAGFEVALEKRKIYVVLPEKQSAEGELIRVIDESGEDYLYPHTMFAPIDLPAAVADALAQSD